MAWASAGMILWLHFEVQNDETIERERKPRSVFCSIDYWSKHTLMRSMIGDLVYEVGERRAEG